MEEILQLTSEVMIAREEIRDLATRWATAVDNGLFDEFESCYAEGATVDFREIGFQGSASRDHRLFLEKSQESFGRMQHVLSNFVFHDLQTDSARVSHMVTAATAMLDGKVFFIGAYYHDDLVRTEQGWRIRHRRAERVYTHNYPAVFEPRETPGNKF